MRYGLRLFEKYEDPRLNDFYSPNTDGSGETTALKYGDRPNSVAVTTRMISVAKLGPTDPVYFMSAAEVAFLQAEAYARLNDVAKAKVAYEQGVNYAFERWGYSAAEFISKVHLMLSIVQTKIQCLPLF